jgi:hypothetical protein
MRILASAVQEELENKRNVLEQGENIYMVFVAAAAVHLFPFSHETIPPRSVYRFRHQSKTRIHTAVTPRPHDGHVASAHRYCADACLPPAAMHQPLFGKQFHWHGNALFPGEPILL